MCLQVGKRQFTEVDIEVVEDLEVVTMKIESPESILSHNLVLTLSTGIRKAVSRDLLGSIVKMVRMVERVDHRGTIIKKVVSMQVKPGQRDNIIRKVLTMLRDHITRKTITSTTTITTVIRSRRNLTRS